MCDFFQFNLPTYLMEEISKREADLASIEHECDTDPAEQKGGMK